ncbi:MAG: hypothetical protein Q8P11_03305 [bacterium]|nr:hypothetical protein [bacterium]
MYESIKEWFFTIYVDEEELVNVAYQATLKAYEYKKGSTEFIKGFQEAIKCYKQILDCNPTHEIALYRLAISYEQIESFNDALSWMTEYIKNYPDNADAFLVCANIYWELGMVVRATDCAEKAYQMNPRSLAVLKWLNLAPMNTKTTTEIDLSTHITQRE